MKSPRQGYICVDPRLIILISREQEKNTYEAPYLLCHRYDKPEIRVKKGQEYHFPLSMNFKYVFAEDKYPLLQTINQDYGEYKIQFLLSTEENDTIRSNILKVNFNR